MKNYNFDFKAIFNGKCTIKANNADEAIKILNEYLYVSGAEITCDKCADEAKNIIDYELDYHGEIVGTNINQIGV